ncbi:Wadjet anti-phage system protein JetD domain-containing protein [Catellatospora sp. NPDC049133]|uniref:Wadjet anti-phage system protein JetD domain-containing protein n=1 Tax=Catellatospora sp. NPDC049133 TaxID=3155499 RepID=UPI0033D8A6A2
MSSRDWTTEADIVAALRRRWTRGELLRQVADGAVWEPVGIPVRGPSLSEIGSDFGRAQDWVTKWAKADPRRLRIQYKTVGGRSIGTNQLPEKAWIDTPEQAWALLGVAAQVQRFRELLDFTVQTAAPLVARMSAHPHRVLDNEHRWPQLINTVTWLAAHGSPDLYLRQVDVPGVDTKFFEANRTVLCDLLDAYLPDDRIDRTRPPSDFVGRYRLRRKPSYARLRYLDPSHGGPFSEITVRVDELASQPPPYRRVFVVENETTYLAFPHVDEAVVILGGGYAVSLLRHLVWLRDREVLYWGDIDTHGLRILRLIRESLPHIRSMLMDHETLLDHREHWAMEDVPTTQPLPLLTTAERRLYDDLVEDTLGRSIRLEQERVRISALRAAVDRA